MSIYQCNACGRLTEAVNVERNGSRCGVRLSGSTWCQGTYNEHGCGGPKEACGAEGCQECGGSRATSDIDLHAKVARLTAEVERLKGREAAAAKVMQAHLDGDATNRMCAAWLAGCKS